MKPSTGKVRRDWFWVGVVLLTAITLLWLAISINILLIFLFPIAIPIGIGIYAFMRGRKKAATAKQPTEVYAIPARERSMQPFSTIRATFKDKTADKLYNRFLSLGIHVEPMAEHPLEMVGGATTNKLDSWLLGSPRLLGLFKIPGRNISYVNIIGQPGGKDLPDRLYIIYLVPLKEIPSSLCWAVLETKKRGLFRREVVGIEWRGGTLADILNDDQTLKQNLLTEFRLNSPLDIQIGPEPIYQCVRIETGLRVSTGIFDCLDRIAELIPPYAAEINSRPATILFQAKVEVNPKSEYAETTGCYVTDRYVRIELKEPLQIPLYMVEDCNVHTPIVGYVMETDVEKIRSAMAKSMVTFWYRDESGDKQKIDFTMDTWDAGVLGSTLRNPYLLGISR